MLTSTRYVDGRRVVEEENQKEEGEEGNGEVEERGGAEGVSSQCQHKCECFKGSLPPDLRD